MAVGNDALPALAPIAGVRLASVAAGIRKPGRRDLVLIELAPETACAAVFTTNRFRAAPVQVATEHLRGGGARYLLINTGSANAGTGSQGLRDAKACCEAVARQMGCPPEAVVPYSTGVIGERLYVAAVEAALPSLAAGLSEAGWADAAASILTTDTRPKGATETVELQGRRITLTGIAKGAGMIRPDMATMLAFIATDAALPAALARRALREASAVSFNRITVDGDTSTNDACTLAATGRSGVVVTAADAAGYTAFTAVLTRLCTRLAQAVVRDGEGATRLVAVRVSGAASTGEAERVAFTVAESPLVKTAVYAADPNWGRLLAAVGRAGIADLEINRVGIRLGEVPIVEAGQPAPNYREADAAATMAEDELAVAIELGRGASEATIWTCDLSEEYVRINADYRS